jgi:hypothetical protein
MFLVPVVVFCLPSIGVATLEVTWPSTAPACRSSCVSLSSGGVIGFPRMSCVSDVVRSMCVTIDGV